MMRRSTQDINTLGAQHIKGAFFFSRRLFEWYICSLYFFFNSLLLWVKGTWKIYIKNKMEGKVQWKNESKYVCNKKKYFFVVLFNKFFDTDISIFLKIVVEVNTAGHALYGSEFAPFRGAYKVRWHTFPGISSLKPIPGKGKHFLPQPFLGRILFKLFHVLKLFVWYNDNLMNHLICLIFN